LGFVDFSLCRKRFSQKAITDLYLRLFASGKP